MQLTKKILLTLVVLILAYFSVEIRPMDAVDIANKDFDATNYAKNFVYNVLPTSFEKAVPLQELVAQLKTDEEVAFDKWSNAIAVGNIGYFMVRMSGSVKEITEDEVVLVTSENINVRLQTEFVYGNAIRDASGLVDNKKFQNTSDLNAIANAVNNIIRQEILPPFKSKVKLGDSVLVIGAVEMNRKFPPLNDFEVQPVQLQNK
ncbi:DUF2291 family protein [Cytophaga sp. FL35]|uniref:DUF2291 family protein n=1 Tax=Cytophaga sp. FL35 TaxID=1904456 RepID=UPI001653E419|nr:DUF2291 family protein [Cytophaga sp. FL35]MBC6998042.1 DUF2291 family protein [Cytophaga sp. FL35]